MGVARAINQCWEVKKQQAYPGARISHDTVIVGDVHFSGNLDIEGLVQGNIIAQSGKEALLRVVGKGRVEGEIRVPCVIVNGVVAGNVYSSKHLELASKSRVQGNVFYSLVEMAAGAEVNGSLTHMANDAALEPPVVLLPNSDSALSAGLEFAAKVD